MGFGRNLLLWGSENKWMAKNLPNYSVVKKAVKRFMPGEKITDVIDITKAFNTSGIIKNAWERHINNSAKLSELGLEPIVPESERLPQLLSISIPSGVNDADVRNKLLDEYNLEIGAGLGNLAGKVWRIGLMGYSSREENISLFLKAMANI